jgi:hypothetical protein
MSIPARNSVYFQVFRLEETYPAGLGSLLREDFHDLGPAFPLGAVVGLQEFDW